MGAGFKPALTFFAVKTKAFGEARLWNKQGNGGLDSRFRGNDGRSAVRFEIVTKVQGAVYF